VLVVGELTAACVRGIRFLACALARDDIGVRLSVVSDSLSCLQPTARMGADLP